MEKQIFFLAALLLTLLAFGYTTRRFIAYFKLTRKDFPVRQVGRRFGLMMEVAFGQTKIFRRPVIGLLHALVFWGFLVILIGSIEMVIDGLSGTERALSFLGVLYTIIMASGDIFAPVIAVAILVFLSRRIFLNVKRFSGTEMKHISHLDANIALTIIFLLMVSLLGMNTFYIHAAAQSGHAQAGIYPLSKVLAGWIDAGVHGNKVLYQVNWWVHILLIFIFANYLPYSKHFHVFMSVPNVFLSRLDPLGKLDTMESITKEVKIMMDPNQAFVSPPEGDASGEETPGRFGILDVEDVSWKSYMDSLACTECGRCTSVCPANITGKKLSPRKIVMDVRARMKEKGSAVLKNGAGYSDNKSLLRDYVSEEELWACTLCNACAQECPININQPAMIVGMRRYLVMEESAAPVELNSIFSNIENNGAPWQFSREDRMLWADTEVEVPLMADRFAKGEKPEFLLWVGSAGAYDDRYKHVSRAFVKILDHLGISYAVLGTEESSSGDVARRAGNEMLFQMQALMNIEIFEGYEVKKILTCDPHVFNTFKNEYPDLGGNYEVVHHTQFLRDMIAAGSLKIPGGSLGGKTITFHDPCYLGRANKEYRAPRQVLEAFSADIREMKRNMSFALCCGAGGGQMFKEAEKGEKEVFIERTEDALATGADIIATACPYCMVMMTDGIKYKNKEEQVKAYDIAELVVQALGI
ncbi:MAG: heterodisulfide reductase-related iron-sulfur binding cluster [Bacteroidota bacterium]